MRWLLCAGLCACATAPVEPRAAVALPEDDPVLREVTRDAVHAAEREGWSLERVGEAEFAVTSRAQIVPVSVPAGECRVFVLVRASGVVEAAAALYLADGRRLDRDLGRSGEPPIVGACAAGTPLGAYWHVSVRGAGLVRGLEFAVARDAAIARGLSEPATVGELALALRRRGFAPRGEERVLQLAPGEQTRFPVALRAHRCLTLVLRGAAGSLTLLEEEQPLVRDGSSGEQAVQLCADDEDRALVGLVETSEGGEIRVQRYDADRQTLGGDEGLWLGERLPPVERAEPPSGARRFDLGPAEVIEVELADREGCTPIRLVAGEGSRGVWLERPGDPKREVDGCVSGPRARVGSVGGGQVWVSLEEDAEAPTPRPPAQRAAHR